MLSKIALKLKRLRSMLAIGEWPEVSFDNTYPWLGWALLQTQKYKLSASRPAYAYGVIQAAAIARALKIERISVVEFGVAGGAGLIALEECATIAEKLTGVKIDVYGFDTGVGLPKPEDYRDQPNMWFEGQLPMNRDLLESKLTRAQLRIGHVRDTVKDFIAEKPAPIGFISNDMDLYSSTRDSFALFAGATDIVLPRVVMYFDDIFGHTYNEFTGERLAINEFNAAHEKRKLSPIPGLRYFLPRLFDHMLWPDCMYYAHFFDHPLADQQDSIKKAVITDIHGRNVRVDPRTDWRADLPHRAAAE
jgi:hypothetical protein